MSNPPTIQSTLTRSENDAKVTGRIQYLSTAEAYDLWSEVYDTDGNFLQALDTIEVSTLLPSAVKALTDDGSATIKAVDLGCGTGRSTLRLLDYENVTEIVGLELSAKMMALAESACKEKISSRPTLPDSASVHFAQYDMIADADPPSQSIAADLAISTLVLEHVELETFFEAVAKILRPGGVLLLTNMHARMGEISQAGFIDPKTGDKIRPTSYAHAVEDVIRVGAAHSFELKGQIKEVSVNESLAAKLGERGKKWIGVTVWFGGIWQKT